MATREPIALIDQPEDRLFALDRWNLLASIDQRTRSTCPQYKSEGTTQVNHERRINNEAVYNCSYCGHEILVPIDESDGVKQEFVDECPKCSHSNVVHIKIDGGGNMHVWVKGHSHEEQKELASHLPR